MRRPPLPWRLAACLLGAAGPAHALTPWPTAPTWRLRVDNVLDADEWRGLRPQAVERFNALQRLQLDLFVLQPDDGRGPRLTVRSDFMIAADLGPDGQDLAAQPDGRRPVLDLFEAAADLRTRHVDAQAGRVLVFDSLGLDALDGARVDVRAVPHLTLHGGAGLAVRRGRSVFGPDLYSPDGTALPTAQARIWTVGLSLRDVPGLALRADWRRQADQVVQREEAAVAARLQGPEGVWLDGGGKADLVYLRAADVWADLGARVGDSTLAAGWRRARPTFSADSIWNAFGPTAWDEAHARATWPGEAWTVGVDGALRWFDLGSSLTQQPARATGGLSQRPDDDQPALDAGARFTRRFSVDGVPGHAGLEGRLGTGYGGQRHLVDLFGRVPVPLLPGNQPLFARARLGALVVVDEDRPDRSGPSGWAVLALDWQASETIRLEALTEGHANDVTGPRIRLMTRMTFTDWW